MCEEIIIACSIAVKPILFSAIHVFLGYRPVDSCRPNIENLTLKSNNNFSHSNITRKKYCYRFKPIVLDSYLDSFTQKIVQKIEERCEASESGTFY